MGNLPDLGLVRRAAARRSLIVSSPPDDWGRCFAQRWIPSPGRSHYGTGPIFLWPLMRWTRSPLSGSGRSPPSPSCGSRTRRALPGPVPTSLSPPRTALRSAAAPAARTRGPAPWEQVGPRRDCKADRTVGAAAGRRAGAAAADPGIAAAAAGEAVGGTLAYHRGRASAAGALSIPAFAVSRRVLPTATAAVVAAVDPEAAAVASAIQADHPAALEAAGRDPGDGRQAPAVAEAVGIAREI